METLAELNLRVERLEAHIQLVEKVERLVLGEREVLCVTLPENIVPYPEAGLRVKEFIAKALQTEPERILVMAYGTSLAVVEAEPTRK